MDEFDIVDNLILNGGLEFAGVNPETGEPLYRQTDRLKDLDSKLSDEISLYFFGASLTLWEKGFINMDVTDKDPLVTLSKKAFDQEEIKKLDSEHRVVLQEIIKTLYNKK